MRKAALVAVLLTLLAAGLLAVTPQKWLVRTQDDVLKGKSLGVSVSSDGELFLAPAEEAIEGPGEEFYLSLASTPDGTLFLGTGHAGKIFRIAKDGKAELWYQAGEMDVTCLAWGSDGALYAGTSPNGKIYKIKEKGKADVFFDPGEKYIWSLLPGDGGSLLAAVGESGGIYEISAEGNAREILKVPDNHILCLKRDKSGTIYAGSGGNGLLYQLSKSGKAFVVFESPFEEIKGLDFDADGNILVAASGTPSRGKKEEVSLASAAATPEVEITVTPSAKPAAETSAPAAAAAVTALAAPSAGKEPSGLFLVTPGGDARKIWGSTEEMIYAVAWRDADKRALVGTGPRGRVYAVAEDRTASLLLQKPSEQVFAFYPLPSGVVELSDNPPHLDVLSSDQRLEGEYQSGVQDAKIVSTWGVISWQATVPAGTSIQLETRSGNSSEPSATWSDWSPPYQNHDGEAILSPKARFLQFRVLLRTASGRVSPRMRRVVLNYLQTNVSPEVTVVGALPPNVVLLKPPESEDVIWGASKTLQQTEEAAKDDDPSKGLAAAKRVERKGMQTVLWEASDDNDDDLSFTILAQKDGETAWHVLEDDWTDVIYAFDTSSLSDGIYRIKVVASDAPSNPADRTLTGEKISAPITIDTTAPVVKNVTATRTGNNLKLSFTAEDNLSAIVEAKWFVRPGKWQQAFPVDGICDSRLETFALSLTLPPNADNLVIIQVKDDHGNVGVYRQGF